MEDALKAYDAAASGKDRAVCAAHLAECVRNHLKDADETGTGAAWFGSKFSLTNAAPLTLGKKNTTLSVGLTIHTTQYPVTIDGIKFMTAMNAFQAMKAPKEKRHNYADVSWSAATAMGRAESIDVISWDANREFLMESILLAQARQHPEFKQLVLDYADEGLFENSMGDSFWPSALPGVWKNVYDTLVDESETDVSANASRVSTSCKRRRYKGS